MKLRLSSEALQEITEAALYYVTESPQAAAQFEDAIDIALNDVRDHPQLYPRLADGVQYKVLDRFPFTIYFVVTDQHIDVFSVAHHKLPPPPWRTDT